MKRVYVVTSGDYSDYHIEQIFSSREKAHLYSLLDPDRCVEEYYMDDIELKATHKYLLVSYDYRYGHNHEFMLRNTPLKPRISKEWRNNFEFTIPMDNDRIYKNIVRYGKHSKVILKIAQDKFAEYLYEHNTSKEELIRKLDKKYNRIPYGFASTSSDFTLPDWRPQLEVNKRVATVLKQMIVDGKPLPATEELQTIYDVTLDEVKKEHEQD